MPSEGHDEGRDARERDPSRRDLLRTAGAAAAAVAAGGAGPAVPASAAAAPESGNEICRMDALTLAEKIRTKQLSPTEATEAVLGRMDRLNPVLGAFCTPTPDIARAQAKQVEANIVAGRPVGPLAGVPLGIKDLVFTKGIRTTSGSVIYKDFVPDEDDVVVERLKAAGAIILGKTNVPELGYSGASYNMIFPPTRNPWNTDRTAGGSSAGSGAAVAAGIGPFAIGSDGGGSVRIPASINGLYGLKASMGRVPLYPGTKDERYPGVSGWESIEHIGPLSRTVADAALMMSVIAGPDDRDRHTLPEPRLNWMDTIKGDIKGLRVAYTPDWGYALVDPEVREVCGRAAQLFESSLGCHVELASPGWEDPFGPFFAIVMTETDLAGMRKLVAKYRGQMMPHLVEAILAPMTDEQITSAIMVRKAVANKSWRFMRNYDLLLTPTIAVPAFAQGIQGPETIDGKKAGPFQWIAFTFPFNLTGQPAASVPAGFTRDGLPVGLQIVGRHLDDPTVLRASAAFEAAAPWRDKWPPMLAQMGL
ncbi:MAG: amidase [Acetobacteraceae bacterium]|nr:amidase [Acetobacteraceae bacterium]